MNFKKVISLYIKKKYHKALKLLRNYYKKYPYDKTLIVLLILVNLKLKKLKKVFFWLKYGYTIHKDRFFKQLYLFFLLESKKIVFFLEYLKNENLSSFNFFLLSLYYYRIGNLPLSLKYSFITIKLSKERKEYIPLYYKWFFIILRKYKILPSNKEILKKNFIKRLYLTHDSIDIYEKPSTLIESLEMLKKKFIINLKRNKEFWIYNPLYQFYLYKVYKIILYRPDKWVLSYYVKDCNRYINKDRIYKNTDNILIRIFIFLLIILFIFMIIRKI